MDNKKVIVTLLVLTIVLSVLTMAFTLTSSKTVSISKGRSTDRATVGLYIAGGEPTTQGDTNSNVGLYVNN